MRSQLFAAVPVRASQRGSKDQACAVLRTFEARGALATDRLTRSRLWVGRTMAAEEDVA